MTKQDEAVHLRMDNELAERIDGLAQKTGKSRSEMIRALIAEGLNQQPTYPLAKFAFFAPERKALYAILTPKEGGGANVWTWNYTENLHKELHNLGNIQELIAKDADILYWEV